jgi:hypothetical protein
MISMAGPMITLAVESDRPLRTWTSYEFDRGDACYAEWAAVLAAVAASLYGWG